MPAPRDGSGSVRETVSCGWFVMDLGQRSVYVQLVLLLISR